MLLITISIALICISVFDAEAMGADAARTGNWTLALCGVRPRSDWNLCAQGHTLSGWSTKDRRYGETF
jgi:hypothetical protein